MTDTISKVIGVFLAFVLLIIAPMTMARMTEDMAMRRFILNDVTMFIDKVTDKGSVTGNDMEDLLLGINSYGGVFDVRVVRYVRIAVPDMTAGGESRSIYVAADDVFGDLSGNGQVKLEVGDAIQVRVEAISRTKAQSLLQGILHVYEKPFCFNLAGTVR